MSAENLFPQYVSRSAEQRRIIAEVAAVQASGRSRAVLLYGPGGVGKTRLARQLPKIDRTPHVTWLDPVDVDDSQHWLLSNLERHVADQLDPDHHYFGPYYEYVSALPRHRLMSASREMVIDQLNRIKAVFTECYKRYIDGTGNSVVMTFDTVEAIRGMYLLRTLTGWMKALPQTVFILAGRSQPDAAEWWDPIRTALEDPPLNMDVTLVPLGEFSAEDCRIYLSQMRRQSDLSEQEAEKLVYLTQGHPLWLAFTVDYLASVGMPQEALAPLDEIKGDLPYHGDATGAGKELVESFKRRLVAPYQESDFWHEAIKRLAVVRESVSQPIWQELMADQSLPDDAADLDDAWKKLKAREWIRLRANQRYITLHDAVAEELAKRVINLQDTGLRWRQGIWRQAAEIYARQAAELEARLAQPKSALDSRLRDVDAADGLGSATGGADDGADLMREIEELDRWQREVDQLQVAELFYQLLSDFRQGAQRFVELLEQARRRHDVLFEDLLAFQMQRFLPRRAEQSPLSDTVGTAINSFRDWLPGDGLDSYVDLGLEMADYFIDREEPETAAQLLDHLPEPADHKRRYRLRKLQGNACMRIPGRVREGGRRFDEALAEAKQLLSPDQYQYISEAHKELGFYYRNIGHWQYADNAYEEARDAILQAPLAVSLDADREEMASIHTNWAYVKGIGGRYDDALNMIESAITIRRKIGSRHEQAISCSVKGEVFRYHREFKAAWDVYAEAQELFAATSLSWLGVIYQEQAICLFQSIPAAVQLLDPPENPREKAESLIETSLDLCRVHNARYYPSALNRAGRIFGSTNPDLGLRYLAEGADRAQEISDGWFSLANLIEYAELCYRTWADGERPEYLELIPAIATRLQEPEVAELEFPELRGRWRILQGHLAMYKALAGDDEMLDVALENYQAGFPLIMHGWVGSYGASAIPGEFRRFRDFALKLPPEVRSRWQREMSRSWSGHEVAAAQLLARLEELY